MAGLNEINLPPGGLRGMSRLCSRWPKGLRSGIDLGCNTGAISIILSNLTDTFVRGIDVSKSMIETAKTRQDAYPRAKVEFAVGNALDLPVSDNSLDYVFSGGSTAFILKQEKAYNECYRAIRPGGIISELHFYYISKPPKELSSSLAHILGFEVPTWDENHWLDLYKKVGFKPLDIFKMKPNVPTKSASDYVELLLEQANNLDNQEENLSNYLVNCFETFTENNNYLGVLGCTYMKPIFVGQEEYFNKWND